MRRAGDDKRGNSEDRAARKRWLMAAFGDGVGAPCFHCKRPLTAETAHADRIAPGQSYRRDNIVPSCGPCNIRRGRNPLPPEKLSQFPLESWVLGLRV